MPSTPTDAAPALGRVDAQGRLVAADPRLAELQTGAGSQVGAPLALPQLASVAKLARKLGIPVRRQVVAAAPNQDMDLSVRAVLEGEEVVLSIEGWTARPPSPPRLGSVQTEDVGREEQQVAEALVWETDEELRLVSVSAPLAEILGVDPEAAIGQPLTKLVKLEEEESGDMPLLAALAARRSFTGQRARSRSPAAKAMVLSGEVIAGSTDAFAGFHGEAAVEQEAGRPPRAPAAAMAIDHSLDEALRSPLDRIIDCAERIAEKAEGPLRSDYAAYASDISAAARHLLSVIRSMSETPAYSHQAIDLAALAAEAVVLLEAAAEERNVTINLDAREPLPARGEERGVIQILVNLIGNAVRHSPERGIVTLRLDRRVPNTSVVVEDEGPGIALADQQRIFERFERADESAGGTGLGLAIARRLARSMGGDITLDSAPGKGARFTLTLPAA